MKLGFGRSAILRAADRIGVRWPGEDGKRFGITTILFHEFFGSSESKQNGLDRLRRMCEWIRSELYPIDMAEYLRVIRDGVVHDRAAFVTFDDAKTKVLDCIDVFREFEIPITIFPACGCLREHDSGDEDIALARTVFLMDRFVRNRCEIRLGNGESFVIGEGDRSAQIDRILTMAEHDPGIGQEFLVHFERLGEDSQAPASMCSWRELKEIKGHLVSIASHSMSHCRLAGKSARRLAFEIEGSRRLLQKHFGTCDMFAYPYGSWDVVSPETRLAICNAGYECSFVVAAGFGRAPDRYAIPRIDIPDAEVDFLVLRSLLRGRQIPLTLLKNALTRRGY